MLEKYWDEYSKKVYDHLEFEFTEKVKPYLEKWHLTFVSGNGGYSIHYTDKTPQRYINDHKGYYKGSIDPESLPTWLYKILSTEIPGMPSNDAGSLMPDYDPN